MFIISFFSNQGILAHLEKLNRTYKDAFAFSGIAHNLIFFQKNKYPVIDFWMCFLEFVIYKIDSHLHVNVNCCNIFLEDPALHICMFHHYCFS